MSQPEHLLPYDEATQDAHCEETALNLCSRVNDGAEASYRKELLARYCVTDQYNKCVWARSLSTLR